MSSPSAVGIIRVVSPAAGSSRLGPAASHWKAISSLATYNQLNRALRCLLEPPSSAVQLLASANLRKLINAVCHCIAQSRHHPTLCWIPVKFWALGRALTSHQHSINRTTFTRVVMIGGTWSCKR